MSGSDRSREQPRDGRAVASNHHSLRNVERHDASKRNTRRSDVSSGSTGHSDGRSSRLRQCFTIDVRRVQIFLLAYYYSALLYSTIVISMNVEIFLREVRRQSSGPLAYRPRPRRFSRLSFSRCDLMGCKSPRGGSRKVLRNTRANVVFEFVARR